MAGMGPAPKPQEKQRRAGRGLAQQTLTLPASGRKGEPPPWPLPSARDRELEIWRELWRTPQAVQWERMGSGVAALVARLAHLMHLAELGAKAPMLGELRQLEDRLCLSPLAMARLGWRIEDDGGDDAAIPSNVLSIRDRMAAVDD